MGEWLDRLFDGSDFPARWHCGNWSEALGWLHVLSDVAIFGAYIAIPVVLGVFLTRRKDIPFPRVLWLFVAFICSCGVGHLVEAIIFWHPIYRFSGLIKFTTAVVSWVTVGAVVYAVPNALRLRSPEALEREVVKRTEELAARARELQRANRELDEFASVASHDLRTPLDGIRRLAGWILIDNDGKLPQASAKHLRQMQQRVDRLGNLLDALLEYARAGRDASYAEDVNVRDMVSDVVAVLAPAAGFDIRTVGAASTVYIQPGPLRQVLLNLINNAIKHHDRDAGSVTVSCRNIDGTAEFVVSDDGPGIDAEFHDQVFGLFERLRPSDEVEGSGMGLALVKRIVERHGGTIRLQSTAGRGASFSFTWPLPVSGAS